MTEPVCLTIEELRDYALGRSEPDRCDEILAHLEDCSVCEDTVGSLENTADSLLDHLRVGPRELGAVPAMAAVAIERAKRSAGSEPSLEDGSNQPPAHVRDYRLLEEVGAGGMGTVFRAADVFAGDNGQVCEVIGNSTLTSCQFCDFCNAAAADQFRGKEAESRAKVASEAAEPDSRVQTTQGGKEHAGARNSIEQTADRGVGPSDNRT